MAIVTISTIFQTVFISIFLLLSKGWGYARSSLSRDDLSQITVIMGTVYLIYSAYFVAVNIEGLNSTVQLLLNSLYVILLTILLKNAYETRQLLLEQKRVIFENNVEPLMDAIVLKVKIMHQILLVAAFYFSVEIFLNGLVPAI